MLEAVRFLFFSTIETISAFVLMLSIFRLKASYFIWPALFVSLMMNLQSFYLREATSLSFLAFTINTLLFILLLATVVRIPIIWASIISITGTFLYTVIQGIIILLLFGTMTPDMQTSSTGSLIQAITSAWVLTICWLLHKFKIGFTADFENLRFKWEHGLVITLIIAVLAICAYLFYINDFPLTIIFLAITSTVFLYYAVKKERDYYS
ncbi:hypothetical protein [Paenibacillus medicaginis]|uniref:DUF1275 domain-containing protein n=1 Tax=Paenibacillus medicaginis TaxID=1470560 RepID=A0ABV5C0M5_9BACL